MLAIGVSTVAIINPSNAHFDIELINLTTTQDLSALIDVDYFYNVTVTQEQENGSQSNVCENLTSVNYI